MASIDQRVNGKWRVRWIDPDSQQRASKVFVRKRDAASFKSHLEHSIDMGDYVNPRRAETPFAVYASEWMESRRFSPARTRVVDNALRLHAVPALGSAPIGRIARKDLQDFVDMLSRDKGLAHGSIRNIVEVLGRVFKDAVADGLIKASPVPTRGQGTLLHIPGREEVRDRFLTPGEVRQLERVAPEDIRLLVVFLSQTGLRIGEALGLQVSDVDVDRKKVWVRRQLTQQGEMTTTKTARSRQVPIPGPLMESLLPLVTGRRPDAPLWLNRTNGRLRYNTFKVRWNLMVANSGLDWHPTAHDLRHYYASYLLQQRIPVHKVSKTLGHASPVKTLQVYAHVIEEDDDEIRGLFAGVE